MYILLCVLVFVKNCRWEAKNTISQENESSAVEERPQEEKMKIEDVVSETKKSFKFVDFKKQTQIHP